MRALAIAVATTLALSAAPMIAKAAPCRDTKGKFVKCPPVKPVPKKPCKDAKGKFIKCPK